MGNKEIPEMPRPVSSINWCKELTCPYVSPSCGITKYFKNLPTLKREVEEAEKFRNLIYPDQKEDQEKNRKKLIEFCKIRE